MEIAAFVISIVALVFSIPSMILSIIHICKEKLNIDFKLDGNILGDEEIVLRKQNKLYYCSSTFLISNKSDQNYTINKIVVVDGEKEEELILLIAHHGQGSFNDVALAGNKSLHKFFQFRISKPKTKKLTFKIYTNKKIFKKKLKYRLS